MEFYNLLVLLFRNDSSSAINMWLFGFKEENETRGSHSVFTINQFRIWQDHILEDAFNQLNVLFEDDLQGLIWISFVNEFGVEEVGIDGGGIFKDFMENITWAIFYVQYELFKETVDHLLYPNHGLGMIHEQHLQFFHFLGIVLGTIMEKLGMDNPHLWGACIESLRLLQQAHTISLESGPRC